MEKRPRPVPGKKPVIALKPNTTGTKPDSFSQIKAQFEITPPFNTTSVSPYYKKYGTDTGPVSAIGCDATRWNQGVVTDNSSLSCNDQSNQACGTSGNLEEEQCLSEPEEMHDPDDTIIYERVGDATNSWLHMTVDRHQAEQILMERGVDGSFLVRPQQRGSGEYAISLKWAGGVRHITIDRLGHMYRFPGYPSFASLAELIQYHTEQDDQLQVMDTFVVLKNHIPSLDYDNSRRSSENEDSPFQEDVGKFFQPFPSPQGAARRPLPSLPDADDSSCVYENIPFQLMLSKEVKPPALPARNYLQETKPVQPNGTPPSTVADSLSVVVEVSSHIREENPDYESVQPEVIWTSEQSEVLNIPGDIPLYQSYEADTSDSEPSILKEDENPYENIDLPSCASIDRRRVSLRGLWSDKVRRSCKQGLGTKGAKLQESLYEILTSEVSYLYSLNLFVTMFLANVNPMTTAACQLRKHEYGTLASNILAVRKISSRFMLAVESEWKRSQPFLSAKVVSQLITDHAQRYFEEYVKYVANHKYQRNQYDVLKKSNRKFSMLADELQQHSHFRNMPMNSFLSLPYQRITRMPLLMEAVAKSVHIGDDGYQEVQYCLEVLKKAVVKCNNKVRQYDSIEALTELHKKIDFGDHTLALISSTRFHVRTGDLTHYYSKKSLLARKKKETLTLLLFNDMLLITRKKGERFVLLDHALKKSVYTEVIGEIVHPSANTPKTAKDNDMFGFKLVLLNGVKAKEYKLSSLTAIDRMKWTYALHPNTIPKNEVVKSDSLIPDESELYANLRRKQVEIIEAHDASDADMLTLKKGDILIVYQELEVWMEGERIRDGQRGWFPVGKAMEIDDPRTCIANMREQQRLLQQSIDAMELALSLKK